MKEFFEKVKKDFISFTIQQKAAIAVLIIAVPLAVALSVNAISSANKAKDTLVNQSQESGQSFLSSSLQSSLSSSEQSSASKAPIKVTLKPSSVEEDLEVQILNEAGEMITGHEFKLTVKSKKGSYNKTWTVDDGFLKLTKLSAGEYNVSIESKEGFLMPEMVECKVEKKVVYDKVDVSDKVVDDSKVDSSKEDSAFNPGGSDQTPPPTVSDTVEYVASRTEVQEKKVEVITYKYTPDLMADGTIKTPQGTSSGIYPKWDSEKKYLVGGYKLVPAPQGLKSAGFYALAPKNMEYKSLVNLPIMPLNADGEQSPTPEATATPTPEATATPTPEPTATPTPQPTATPTPEPTATPTPEPTATPTPQPTATPTPSPSPSASPSPSPSVSPSPTPTPSKVEVAIFDANGNPLKDAQGNLNLSLQKHEVKETVLKKVTLYYGWQTIDGKKYYYDKDAKKVTGTQIIQGITYYFDKDGVMGNRIGVDVSKYQGNIDWKAVKESGIEFAIIRVGYRGYGTGVLVEDPYFRKNIKGATDAGLKVGVYFFTQAITAQEAVEEASMVLDAVKGYKLAYPIFFDTEYVGNGARADGLSKSHRTTIAKAFCETIKNNGYKAGVYASKSWFYNQLEYSQISGYNIWVAHYTASTDFAYRYDIWQYTGSGRCPGIGGAVDLNIGYTAY